MQTSLLVTERLERLRRLFQRQRLGDTNLVRRGDGHDDCLHHFGIRRGDRHSRLAPPHPDLAQALILAASAMALYVTCNRSFSAGDVVASRSKSTSSRAKVAAHRARLRAQGLRPVQIWVPDVRSPEFKAEAERQAHLVAMDPHEAETMAFIEAVADWGDEE